MSHAEATAWWTEVEELRERIERRRTLQTESPQAETRPAGPAPRRSRTALAAVPADPSWRDEPVVSERADESPSRRRRSSTADWNVEAPAAADTGRVAGATAVEGARRTVRIRGQAIPTVVAPRLREADAASEPTAPRRTDVTRARPYGTSGRARPARRPAERIGSNPDRLAAWAFGLALLTLLVAAISAHGL